jgi:thiamine-phosphate pyrophosphorylase
LIYLITKGEATAENFREKSSEILSIVEKAVRAEISLIQIREKNITAGQVFELASRAARLTRNSNTKLLLNDRADIALASGADGVHLTAKSLRAEVVRRNFGVRFIVGVSAHSLEDIREAKFAGADLATFSPVFKTASKAQYGAPQGLEKLREAVAEAGDFPIIALGGIDARNFSEALRAGAKGIAAISFLNDAENLPEIAKKVFSFRNIGGELIK